MNQDASQLANQGLTRRELLRLSAGAGAFGASLLLPQSLLAAEPQKSKSDARQGNNLYSQLLQTWCDGMIAHHASIARTLGEQLGLPDPVLAALGAAYERWDGRGWPGELEGVEVPVASMLAQMAEYVEVANRMGGVEAVRELARDRRGEQFGSALADLVTAEAAVILSGLDTVATWDAVIQAVISAYTTEQEVIEAPLTHDPTLDAEKNAPPEPAPRERFRRR